MQEVKRTERGWAGHFICADSCRFRRNTLLEYNDKKIIVSTVGCYVSELNLSSTMDIYNYSRKETQEIGANRYYETMAFVGTQQGAYIDCDVSQQIDFDSEWAISEMNFKDDDNRANDMHEKVVEEITNKLLKGEIEIL